MNKFKRVLGGVGKHWRSKPKLRLASFVIVGVCAIGLVAFLLANTKAWQGDGAVFPTENPPQNLSNSSAVSTNSSLASDPSNTSKIYAVWAEDGNIWFKGSTDGGTSWGTSTNISSGEENTPHGNPDIAVSSSGRIHVVYQTSAGYSYRYSDGGSSWSSAATYAVLDTTSPKIAADGAKVAIVWLTSSDALMRAKSINNGSSSPFDSILTIGGFYGHTDTLDFAVNSSGATNWLVSFNWREECGSGNSAVVASHSNDLDNWSSWLHMVCINQLSGRTALSALPYNNTFYMAYEAIASGIHVIRALSLRLQLANQIISGPDIVSDPTKDAYNPAITSDANGYVHFAWQSLASQ